MWQGGEVPDRPDLLRVQIINHTPGLDLFTETSLTSPWLERDKVPDVYRQIPPKPQMYQRGLKRLRAAFKSHQGATRWIRARSQARLTFTGTFGNGL